MDVLGRATDHCDVTNDIAVICRLLQVHRSNMASAKQRKVFLVVRIYSDLRISDQASRVKQVARITSIVTFSLWQRSLTFWSCPLFAGRLPCARGLLGHHGSVLLHVRQGDPEHPRNCSGGAPPAHPFAVGGREEVGTA